MGLMKDLKRMKQKKVILDFFADFGISEADFRYLVKAIEYMKANRNKKVDKTNEPTEEEKKKYRFKADNSMTADQLAQSFAEEVEEYYPNGKA